ncbi:MAG: response regulator transcription factor [Ignavibacteria bacterium]|nr:response regulator transcription factor [Ignavibacteria bacterium]
MRTLIVDDEPLAREGVRRLLASVANIEIIGECADGVQAFERILAAKPDLVFLDVQMPELDGFGVIRKIGPENMPMVIFVTAYDEFAIRAFDVHALDYLLKPIDPDRFALTLSRVRSSAEDRRILAMNQKLVSLLEDVTSSSKYLDRISVKSGGKIVFVKTNEVEWIQAEGDYVSLHTQGKKHLVRGKIGQLQERLDPRQFARIHRSIIVNIDQIIELQPLFYGEYRVTLRNGTKLTLSRSYKEKLNSLLNQHL